LPKVRETLLQKSADFLVNPIKLVYSNHDRYLKIIFYQFVNVCEKDKESKNA